ncbi:MAG: 4Fe-4S binding protein [Paracoccaceae bacterium]
MTDATDKPAKPAKNRKTPHPARTRTSTRAFASIGAGVVAVTAGLVGLYPVVRRCSDRLRPPGALDEQFFASCIKCGQCVQVCPVQAIKLGDGDEGYGFGVPHIMPAPRPATLLRRGAMRAGLSGLGRSATRSRPRKK